MQVSVLFLVFNRPAETKLVFDAIRKAQPERLYIACDGARKNKAGEDKVVDSVRKICENIDWPCSVRQLYRKENLGCKIAVSEAINWFFEFEEMGIIIEDDCLPSDSFFTFCNKMLIQYQHDERVAQICGFIPVAQALSSSDFFFSYLGSVWGWATWRRSWKNYDLRMRDWPIVLREDSLSYAYVDKGMKLRRYLAYQKTYDGLIDTWDYQWSLTRAINNQLCILPRLSLIKNIGFNEAGSHMKGRPHWLKYNSANELDLTIVVEPYGTIPNQAYERQISSLQSIGLLRRVYLRFRLEMLKLTYKRKLK